MTEKLPVKFTVHPALQNLFGYCLYKAAMRMRAKMDQKLVGLELLAPQCGMLKLLDVIGPMSQNELSDELCIDKTSIVKFVDKLEKKQLVKRATQTTDRRVKKVSITPKGQKLISIIAKLRKEVEKEYLEPLTEHEKQVLFQAIPKLLK